jgi:hypothetical protein
MVKAAPLLATILCRWFGRLAMPIGDALSAVVGGISEILYYLSITRSKVVLMRVSGMSCKPLEGQEQVREGYGLCQKIGMPVKTGAETVYKVDREQGQVVLLQCTVRSLLLQGKAFRPLCYLVANFLHKATRPNSSDVSG